MNERMLNPYPFIPSSAVNSFTCKPPEGYRTVTLRRLQPKKLRSKPSQGFSGTFGRLYHCRNPFNPFNSLWIFIWLPVLPQKLQSLFQFFCRDKKFILPKNRIFLAGERQLIFFAHHDRFFRANLFTETAEDTAEHVDFKFYRIAFLPILTFRTLHFNGESRTNACA